LAKITPCTQNNKTSLAPNVEGGFATTEVYPIHSGVDLEPIFLLYFLRSPKVRNVLKKSMVGATGRQRVPTEAVEFLEIPLPSMSEQKRIVAKLDALSAGKDKMMYTLNNRLDYLKRLKYSILYSAFNGQL
jgi:type I restriction enzyme S subunit